MGGTEGARHIHDGQGGAELGGVADVGQGLDLGIRCAESEDGYVDVRLEGGEDGELRRSIEVVRLGQMDDARHQATSARAIWTWSTDAVFALARAAAMSA